MFFRSKKKLLFALVFASSLGSLLRFLLWRSGPDLDSDAYGHFGIGLHFFENPSDLKIHWVWLPLWHLVDACFAALGLSMNAVRFFNLLLCASFPFLLSCIFFDEKSHTPPIVKSSKLAKYTYRFKHTHIVLSAFISVCWPLAIEHGQTAEPESLFTFFTLTSVLAFERERYFLMSLLLSFAVLLRYEAWVLCVALFMALAMRLIFDNPKSMKDKHHVLFSWPFLCAASRSFLLPCVVLLVYLYAHFKQYGEWFAFITQNQHFVHEARSHVDPSFGPIQSWFWYAVIFPWRTFGVFYIFFPAGLLWLLTCKKRSLQCVTSVLLAFISYGWVRGQHLGLDRHLFVLLPFFSSIIASGMLETWGHLTHLIVRRDLPSLRTQIYQGLLFFTYLSGFWVHTYQSTRLGILAHRQVFSYEQLAANILRMAPPSRIFCDNLKVQILSQLPKEQFYNLSWNDLTAEKARIEGKPYAHVLVVESTRSGLRLSPKDLDATKGERVLLDTAEVQIVELKSTP